MIVLRVPAPAGPQGAGGRLRGARGPSPGEGPKGTGTRVTGYSTSKNVLFTAGSPFLCVKC